MSGMAMSNCPMMTPTMRVAATEPSEKDPKRIFPSQKPSPSVRNRGMRGWDWRKDIF